MNEKDRTALLELLYALEIAESKTLKATSKGTEEYFAAIKAQQVKRLDIVAFFETHCK